MTAELALTAVTAGYGGAPVIRDISLSVAPGEVVTLIGANGSGKTTTLRTIAGLVWPVSGHVIFDSVLLERMSPTSRARMGIATVPESQAIFPVLTVAEHLRLGYRRERVDSTAVYRLFPQLHELHNRRAGLLSGGEQRMLAVGRALARRPRLLLLDELSLGLAPMVVHSLLPVIRQYAQETGCGVFLVEQHVELALSIADRGYVMTRGEITVHRPVAELRADKHLLLASYFGH
jgi:branched-chain amino acid transport system ATP-binding protein